MKIPVSLLLVGCVLVVSCTAPLKPQPSLTSTVQVTGATGSVVTGYYIRNGGRILITNTLPFTVTETGLSELELRKVDPQDEFSVKASRGERLVTSSAPPGVPGLLIRWTKGVEVRNLK
jgi:hypothetical protein